MLWLICAMAQINNPIPKLLELIPYTETLLDPLLLDQMQRSMIGTVNCPINNSLVLLLLEDIAKAGLITAKIYSWPSANGSLIIIQRIDNGKS